MHALSLFAALLASSSAFALTTSGPTQTVKRAANSETAVNSGIFNSQGKAISSPHKNENLIEEITKTVNLMVSPPQPAHISLSNAERMRRGLGPKAPFRKRSALNMNMGRGGPSAPRSSCAAVAPQGKIAVYDQSNNIQLGWISSTYDDQNSYTYTTSESKAQVFSIPSTNQYNTLIDIEAVNGPDSAFPFLGGVGGSGGYELAEGQPDYVYLSGVGKTDPGSTPSNSAGNSIEALGYIAPSESAIFALSCNLELGVQWVDDIGFTTPKTEYFFVDPSVQYIGVTADINAFNNNFPGEGGFVVTLKYVPN